MAVFDFEPAIRARLARATINADAETTAALARYLAILARWNRRINLTAFDLDHPTDAAIDRLIVEPVVAAAEIGEHDRTVIDVGSGGGSPAIPLRIVVPRLHMTLIESRVRKSAFLREASRDLGLNDVRVETFRLESEGRADLNGAAEIVTMRAVRADREMLEGIRKLLTPNGRLLWFRDQSDTDTKATHAASWRELPIGDRSSAFVRVLTPKRNG